MLLPWPPHVRSRMPLLSTILRWFQSPDRAVSRAREKGLRGGPAGEHSAFPVPLGVNPTVLDAFLRTQVDQPSPDPKYGDVDFPPPLARGPLDEALVRSFYPAIEHEPRLYEFHSRLRLRPRPSVDLELAFPDHPTGHYRVRTNSRGMRNDNEPSSLSPGLRILMTGASNAHGVMNNDESVAGVLERSMGESLAETTIEVLNAGCGSYNFYNYVAVLEEFKDLRPDVFVVLAYTGNDFFGGVKQWRYFRGLGPPSGGAYSGTALQGSESAFERQLLGLEMGQVTYTLNNPGDEDLAVCVACSAVLEMLSLCEAMGTELVFGCLPPPLVGQPKRMRAIRRNVEAGLALPSDAIDVSDRIGDRWIDFLRDRGLTVCDFRPHFRARDEPLYFPTDGHANLAAHRLMGDQLAQTILAARSR